MLIAVVLECTADPGARYDELVRAGTRAARRFGQEIAPDECIPSGIANVISDDLVARPGQDTR